MPKIETRISGLNGVQKKQLIEYLNNNQYKYHTENVNIIISGPADEDLIDVVEDMEV